VEQTFNPSSIDAQVLITDPAGTANVEHAAGILGGYLNEHLVRKYEAHAVAGCRPISFGANPKLDRAEGVECLCHCVIQSGRGGRVVFRDALARRPVGARRQWSIR